MYLRIIEYLSVFQNEGRQHNYEKVKNSWEKKVAINLEKRWKFMWLYIYKDVFCYSGYVNNIIKIVKLKKKFKEGRRDVWKPPTRGPRWSCAVCPLWRRQLRSATALLDLLFLLSHEMWCGVYKSWAMVGSSLFVWRCWMCFSDAECMPF